MKTNDNGLLQTEVQEYLINHGMKQQHFSGLIDQSPQMFSFWLKQKVSFKKETQDKIRQILHASKS